MECRFAKYSKYVIYDFVLKFYLRLEFCNWMLVKVECYVNDVLQSLRNELESDSNLLPTSTLSLPAPTVCSYI